MSVALGEGDNTDTIERLLDVVESHAIELGKELAALTADWLAGYIGTSQEPRVRALVNCAFTP